MLSNFQLKIIAIFFMTLSHIEYHLSVNPLLYVGQLSFIIFAFLISEGFHHTRNKKNYITRLLTYGLILQLPLFLLGFSYINIFITLGLGALAIYDLESKNFLLITPILIFAYLFNLDYGIYGIIIIITFYYLNTWQNLLILCLLNIIYINILGVFTYYQYFSLLAFIFIFLYNGKLGYRKLKYFFYLYYPLHIMIIISIKLYVL